MVERMSDGILVPQYLPIKGPTAKERAAKVTPTFPLASWVTSRLASLSRDALEGPIRIKERLWGWAIFYIRWPGAMQYAVQKYSLQQALLCNCWEMLQTALFLSVGTG